MHASFRFAANLGLFLASACLLQSAPFQRSATLHGITFEVSSPNAETANTVTVTPSGLAEDNRPFTTEVAGPVTGMEVADIDANGAPEVYVFIKAPQRGELLGFSSNRNKSLSFIFVPELKEEAERAPAYRGGDEFAVLENAIGRRFPLFTGDSSDPQPTGKMRQVQYKLVAGEAGWLLQPVDVVDF